MTRVRAGRTAQPASPDGGAGASVPSSPGITVPWSAAGSGGRAPGPGSVPGSPRLRVPGDLVRAQRAPPQGDRVDVAVEAEVAVAPVLADLGARGRAVVADPQRRGHGGADLAPVDVEPQRGPVERARHAVPRAVPHVAAARGRRDEVALAVEHVERDAARGAGVEAVGAGDAAVAPARHDVAPRAGAGRRAHHRLGGQRRRGEDGGARQADERVAVEVQGAARGAGDPRGVAGVGDRLEPELAVEVRRARRRPRSDRRPRRSAIAPAARRRRAPPAAGRPGSGAGGISVHAWARPTNRTGRSPSCGDRRETGRMSGMRQ